MNAIDRVVVVGGGQAGAWAARTLATSGFGGRVVLIGAEVHHPYERPPLSKAMLAGTLAPEDCTLLSLADADALAIDVRPNLRVQRIDRAGRSLDLSDGTTLSYDRLILSTGGRARALDLPGGDPSLVHLLRTLDDALALGRALRGGRRRVAIIGGGWIGLEVAASSVTLGHDVTVIEAADRLCARSVPPLVSTELTELHERHGVRMRFRTAVTAIARKGGDITLELSDGTVAAFDVVVAGVGLVPEDRLAVAAGLVCDRGVVVDTACRTSDPHIYAAGDVAVLESVRRGRRVRYESWQNAQDQGIATARSVLGQQITYDPVPTLWSEQYAAMIQLSGWAEAAERFAVRRTGDQRMVLGCDAAGLAVFALAIDGGRAMRTLSGWVSDAAAVDLVAFAQADVPLASVARVAA